MPITVHRETEKKYQIYVGTGDENESGHVIHVQQNIFKNENILSCVGIRYYLERNPYRS